MYQLPKDRLYVTYFEGDPKNGLAPDNEARQFWLDQGVLEDHILTGDSKDNFWGSSPRVVLVTFFKTRLCRDGCDRAMWALQVLNLPSNDISLT